MMEQSLVRGENVQVEKDRILVGIGWDKHNSFNVDASAFLVNQESRVRSSKDFIFYNQRSAENGCLILDPSPVSRNIHREFSIDLSAVPEDISRIVLTITLDSGQDSIISDFRSLGNVYLQVSDHDEKLLIRYDLKEVHDEQGLIFGELYRYHESWKFRAVGCGYRGGLEPLAISYGVELNNEEEQDTEKAEHETPEHEKTAKLRKRKTRKEAIHEKACQLKDTLDVLLPKIQSAVDNQCNESNTRMLIDRILTDAFGYSMEEIKAEQHVQGRKADYVLAAESNDMIVGEAKKAGATLRDKHVFQATSYGAYSGIQWAFLTNLSTWQIYHISAHDKVEANLVFSVSLLPEVTLEDCEHLLLISRYGITRPELIERYWDEIKALTKENVIRAILADDVINKIRIIIKRDSGCNFGNEQIQQVVEDLLSNL